MYAYKQSVRKEIMIRSVGRPSLRTIRVAAGSNGIFPPYFNAYINSVCANVPERVQDACVMNMRIPNFQEQQRVVDKLMELKDSVDLGSADGTALLLLLKKDEETLDAMLMAITMYHSSLEMVRTIVSDTMNMIVS